MRQARKSRRKGHYLAVLICFLQLFHCTEMCLWLKPWVANKSVSTVSGKPLEGCAQSSVLTALGNYAQIRIAPGSLSEPHGSQSGWGCPPGGRGSMTGAALRDAGAGAAPVRSPGNGRDAGCGRDSPNPGGGGVPSQLLAGLLWKRQMFGDGEGICAEKPF